MKNERMVEKAKIAIQMVNDCWWMNWREAQELRIRAWDEVGAFQSGLPQRPIWADA